MQGYLDSIGDMIANWAKFAPVAAALERYQRDLGFSPILTGAEMQQLVLQLQHRAAKHLAHAPHIEQQAALALHRTAQAVSRQLCELQPGSAACLLQLAFNTTEVRQAAQE